MKKKIYLGALLAVAVLGGCGSSASTTDSSMDADQDAAADRTAITIQHIAFDPPILKVSSGTTVTWTNRDSDVTHTITSGKPGDKGIPGVNEGRPDKRDGVFDGSVETDGSTFDFTFDETGTYPYFCKVHPVMTGTIVVE